MTASGGKRGGVQQQPSLFYVTLQC